MSPARGAGNPKIRTSPMPITCTKCGTPKRVRTGSAKPGKLRGLYCPSCQSRHQREWERRHPEALRAHRRVALAKAKGELTPQPCEVCGGTAEAHHPDYADPLAVTWLCRAHHRERHRNVVGR